MLFLALTLAHGAIVPATAIIDDDDTLLGDDVVRFGPGSATASGGVVYTVDIGDLFSFIPTDDCVFLDQTPLFCGSDVSESVYTGVERSIGGTDAGQFVYSPFVDGSDSVYGHNGVLALQGEVPPGAVSTSHSSTFHSGPLMRASGVAYWVGGISFTGGILADQRVLYRAPDADPAAITRVYEGGTFLPSGDLLRTTGIRTTFDVSNDDDHLVTVFDFAAGAAVYVDGATLVAEGGSTGSGDNWEHFDLVSIDNDGDVLFTGDTDGPAASDAFLALNGDVVVREGDTVAGMTLTAPASVRFAALNDAGAAAYAWQTATDDVVFYACDAADPAAAVRLLTLGDEVDLDGDGLGDATVTTLDPTAADAYALAGDGSVFVEADLDYGTRTRRTLLRLEDPCCTDSDGDGVCDTELDVTPMVRGQSATLTVTGAQPGAQVFFLASRLGVQPGALCHPTLPVCADLVSPVFFPPAVASASGAASVTVRVPFSLPAGVDVDFQAVWLDSSAGVGQASEVERRTLQ